eukprot:TRINITY_DN34192_c0_g1_i1.p1 TRINITY_DN34192_c0_g1~~TRINITY_DN34192_c0_g1_i1.p1  ORF type:complete len:262 (-),score=27.69 TRINITY_DN34192_c0_g1_i1:363-1148(-)
MQYQQERGYHWADARVRGDMMPDKWGYLDRMDAPPTTTFSATSYRDEYWRRQGLSNAHASMGDADGERMYGYSWPGDRAACPGYERRYQESRCPSPPIKTVMAETSFTHGGFPVGQCGGASVATGKFCSVRKHKHGKMGCAVVLTQSMAMREALLDYVRTLSQDGSSCLRIGGKVARLQPHVDKYTNAVALTDVYMSWGNASEKESPLPIEVIVDTFDDLLSSIMDGEPTYAPRPEDVPSCRFYGQLHSGGLMRRAHPNEI